MDARVQDVGPFAGHSPDRERPLGGYGVLTGSFLVLAAAFAAWLRGSGRELPERMEPGDLVLVAASCGWRSSGCRAIGELLVCPYCIGLWFSAVFTAGLIVAPRPTRWTAAVLAGLFGSDLLQIAYARAEANGY